MTGDELAAIVARDAAPMTGTGIGYAVQAIEDRRALIALLRETQEAAREYLAHDGSGLRLDADNPWRGDWDAVKNYDNLRVLRAVLALAEP